MPIALNLIVSFPIIGFIYFITYGLLQTVMQQYNIVAYTQLGYLKNIRYYFNNNEVLLVAILIFFIVTLIIGQLLGFLDHNDTLITPRFYTEVDTVHPSLRKRMRALKTRVQELTDFDNDFT